MGIIEIIAAFLLILACIFIVAVVLMQDSKQDMSNVITGGSTDNYFQRNSGRTKEAKLAKATKAAAIMFFVIAIAVNLASIYLKDDGSQSTPSTPSTTPELVVETATDTDFDEHEIIEDDSEADEVVDTDEAEDAE